MKDRSEKAIMNASLVEVSSLPETLAWRNNTGMAWQGIQRPVRKGQTLIVQAGMVVLMEARPITFGLPGSGDILGVNAGRAFALEAKTLTGKQHETQLRFQAAFERAGGLYGVFRSEEEALAILGRG
ncbi:hypothetical protein D3Y57_06980 [Sphingomonas paeninsulae]|uniref:VRR-NUC domain-containing protein n=1 Tax=Sphingomonas paeninsulae TaxID=2319844 RepID=A0A494TJ13_SPHPE|nr:hypothetical protein [Sphingomonas paeninsulae]AYJ85761.1 hypothetical protein D3Y57_06980 [Sphingomonas paeninsulae]